MYKDDLNDKPYFKYTDYHKFPGGRKKMEYLVDNLKQCQATNGAEPILVMDLGCGNGSLTYPIASLGYKIVGFDVDKKSIEFCQKNNSFENASFTHTPPEEPNSFDFIICSEVLEHLYEPDVLLSYMYGVLKPCGIICITIPNGYGLREVFGRLENGLRENRLLSKLLDVLRKGAQAETESDKHQMHTSNPDQGHVQKFTTNKIRRLLNQHNFHLINQVNSFFLFSIFGRRGDKVGLFDRIDSKLADYLPFSLASGWYFTVKKCNYGAFRDE